VVRCNTYFDFNEMGGLPHFSQEKKVIEVGTAKKKKKK
jgi:hypothetical protein